MLSGIFDTLIEKQKISDKFSLQIDETRNNNKRAQLLSVARFIYHRRIYILQRASRANYWPRNEKTSSNLRVS